MAASLFGMLGVVSREANDLGVGALPFVVWRAALATVALVGATVLMSALGRAPLPDPRGLPSRRRLALLATCIFGATLNIAMFAAFLRAPIALALICFYTFPAIVTVAAARIYDERLDRIRLGALLLSSGGLVLVVLAPLLQTGQIALDAVGIGLALFAAVCQASFILVSAPGYSPFRSLHVATYVVAAAVVITAALILATGELAGALRPLDEPRVWVWLLAGGLAGAAVPTTLFLAGIGMIGPSRAAILMTFEPVVGVALAAAFLGEQPGPLQLVGGVAVLAAAVILQASPSSRSRAEPEYPQLV